MISVEADTQPVLEMLRRKRREIRRVVTAGIRDQIAPRALVALEHATPVVTGETQDAWRIDRIAGGVQIVNPLPWVGRLRDGRVRYDAIRLTARAVRDYLPTLARQIEEA